MPRNHHRACSKRISSQNWCSWSLKKFNVQMSAHDKRYRSEEISPLMAPLLVGQYPSRAGGHLSVEFEGWANEARHNCDKMALIRDLHHPISGCCWVDKLLVLDLCCPNSQSRSILNLSSCKLRRIGRVSMCSLTQVRCRPATVFYGSTNWSLSVSTHVSGQWLLHIFPCSPFQHLKYKISLWLSK